jgi:hypothetical protein
MLASRPKSHWNKTVTVGTKKARNPVCFDLR